MENFIFCAVLGESSECSSSKKGLQVKKVTGNGLLNRSIDLFKNFSDYIFYKTLIVFFFLENKMCKF